MSNLFVRKPLSLLLREAGDSEKGLKRTLGAGSLIALGIGAIIGAGLFVRTAAAAADSAGPSVTLGFVLAQTRGLPVEATTAARLGPRPPDRMPEVGWNALRASDMTLSAASFGF